ncbi:MAG TPA: histidinol dehydrogenase [Vicinamibacterales bacterium]|nr:histidinol dehydrogenase [Vicinamibacterales bacterium]
MRLVARIIRDVRKRGDAAVRDWSKRFGDAAATEAFEIPRREWRAAARSVPREVRNAIRMAAANVRRVSMRQLPRPFSLEVRRGVRIDQRVQPFERVGCYVPGGRYPLPSSLLMTVIPALIAGVRDVTVACPNPTPEVLFAAIEAGATRVLRIGGAQGIAALAYGTSTIARVDKIAGPGNAWVAAAKDLVAVDCAIDMHAGPSEIVVWAERGNASWIAADLVAQAEHDPAARAIFVTTSARLARLVKRELQGVGQVVRVRNRQAAIDEIDRIAPEHLVCMSAKDAAAIRNAGTIFVGPWSAQAGGDYTTGSNHVLPTSGAARWRGGLSPADFVRVFTVQTLTRQGLRAIGPAAAVLADAEGLSRHARSIRIRL